MYGIPRMGGDEPMNGGGGNMEQGYSLYKRG